MKVTLAKLDGTDILRLDVVDPRHTDLPNDQAVGYLCPHCRQADETRSQIWHERDCRYAGEHGRTHYEDLEPDVPGRPTPELQPEHEIDMVLAGESRQGIDVHNGELLAFRCECGNLDEDLLEVVHDSRCELADSPGPLTDHDDVPVQPARTDGGR